MFLNIRCLYQDDQCEHYFHLALLNELATINPSDPEKVRSEDEHLITTVLDYIP